MSTWNTRGLRGSQLEELINKTIEKYREKGLALIQKIPTPITPVRIDPGDKQITLAYFDKKSTVDYIGVIQGVPVCFDAKEVHTDTFALQNIHEHQMRFLSDFKKQGGIAFFIINYANRDEYYYLNFNDAEYFWNRSLQGGRKSFRYEELDKTRRIELKQGMYVHFLPQIQRELWERKDNEEDSTQS